MISAICLALICVGLGAIMIKQGDLIDEQMGLVRKQKTMLEQCITNWNLLTLVPKIRLMFDPGNLVFRATHDDPEEQAKGQVAIDDLQRIIEEIKEHQQEQ